MKNVKLIFTSMLMSVLFFTTSMAFASSFGVETRIQVVHPDNGHKSISIRIPQSDTPKVTVKLEDSKGETLYSKKSKGEDGVATLLNVNSLPNGMYYITVEDNYKITKQPLRIELDKVVVDEYKMATTQKPTFQYNTRRRLVSLNILTEGEIDVLLLNENGHKLLVTKEMGQLNKTFNLKNLNQGNYTFIMSYNGKTFYENILVK